MSEPTCDRCDKPMAEEDERECEECCEVLCSRCMYDATLCNDGGRRVGMRDASAVVCLDTEAELCKSVAEAFRQGRTSVEVGERLFIWGAAVPGITEVQVAEEMKRLIVEREREARQLEVVSNGLRANTMTLVRLQDSLRYESTIRVNPRSKRGQRTKRWR